MNLTEASRVLGCNERTLRRARDDGRLPAVRHGRSWDIDLDDARRVVGGNGARSVLYQDALAEALQLLRAFDHEADAVDLEARYGLEYVEPRARVRQKEPRP